MKTAIILVILAIFTVLAEGVRFNLFTLWNLLPLAVVAMLLLNVRYKWRWCNMSAGSRGAVLGFVLGSLGFTFLMHLAWMLDLGGTATGSSTSGLIFIFIPIYSLGLGILGTPIGWLCGKSWQIYKERQSAS